jgi:hypothetical protein
VDFSWVVVFLSLSVTTVVVEGVLSWNEGTFWPHQVGGKAVKLPFILHGGVVLGDLILLPYAFSFWASELRIPLWLWGALFFLALWITWLCHRAWWFQCERQPGFMYPDRQESWGDPTKWFLDLPGSAWVHFVYMTGALVFIGAYIWSPMDPGIVWQTFWIFVVFVPTAIIEPGIVQGWPPTRKDILISVGVAIVLWGVIVLVTWIKLSHWLGL